MSPKPMRIVSRVQDRIILRGYTVQAMSPFGWIDFEGQNYGLTIILKDDKVEKCVLHMHDRKVDIEYMK